MRRPLLAVLVLVAACDFTNVNTNTTQVVGPSQPSPAPSVSPPPGGPVARVSVAFFGKSCPSGTAIPSGQNELRVGCTGFLTATPRDAAGNPLPPAVHGPDIDWQVVLGANICRLDTVSEPFNRDARALAVGLCKVAATVKGVVGSLDIIVVP